MKSRSPTPPQPHQVWICVFEIHDATIPTRSPDKPRIRVARTPVRPGIDLEAWVARARARKKSDIVRILTEVMPGDHESGGLHRPFQYPGDQDQITNTLQELREKLRCEGYTIEADQTVWHVYAIELADAHLATKPKNYRGHAYVGQTSHPVEERVEQHRLGPAYRWTGRPKHSPYCHKYFRRPALELVPAGLRGPIFCSRLALEAERDLRMHLEATGYRVVGGTELLPKTKARKKRPDSRS